ncbi:MAG: ABC transporter permease [Bordetella sp.]|uniref:ABC transporter permease n=1 Tax=Bordetella sp. TaxID=28081 RepID=UPI003F7C40F9
MTTRTSSFWLPILRSRQVGNWLAVAPFFLFALLFLILPTLNIVVGAFRDVDGHLTLGNLVKLFTPSIRDAFWLSIQLSVLTAVLGCFFGFMIAAALVFGRLPGGLRNSMLTFCGVAANFSGVPLSFAFIATLGRLGFATLILRNWFGVNLYATGFDLISFTGLTITYLYFQIPLMILIILPALEGLRKEWSEAAASLGASGAQYWRMVALPVLWPSLLGTLALLFANSFGAVATAIALTGSSLSIAPIVLFAQIRGDVLNDPHLGYAIAFAMIALTGVANGIYIFLRMRAERWVK